MRSYGYIPLLIISALTLGGIAYAVLQVQASQEAADKTYRLARTIHAQHEAAEELLLVTKPNEEQAKRDKENLARLEELKELVQQQRSSRPVWREGTSLQQGRRLLQACLADRIGTVVALLTWDEGWIEEMVEEMATDTNTDEITALAAAGVLFGCWEYDFATRYGTPG